MTLLALSYPTIAEADRKWIQAIRAEHDPQYDLAGPHFTLVFPTSSHPQETFIEHVRAQAQGQAPIAITLACAIIVKDSFSDATHTFLVPDQGFSGLVKLHDKLYSGLFASELRLDLPFIPHITVASSLDPDQCKGVADQINREMVSISGMVDVIDVVSLATGTVTTLEQIVLAR